MVKESLSSTAMQHGVSPKAAARESGAWGHVLAVLSHGAPHAAGKKGFTFLLIHIEVTAQNLLENQHNSRRRKTNKQAPKQTKKPNNHEIKCVCQVHKQLNGKSYRSDTGVPDIFMCFKVFRRVNFLIQDVQKSINPSE